ncbi:MAG: alkaline phosphatase family protein [Gammaproteobacteria bacterium]
MAEITSGPLRGFYRPDYEGASLVNLMATLIRARGGDSPHPGLDDGWQQRLSRPRHLVLLIVDGLGLEQRQRYLAQTEHSPFLGERSPLALSSVFPATTAAAVTTLMTGASPAEHGILGWFLNLHDLGVVSAILPTTSRTEMAIVDERFPLRDYLAVPRPVETMRGRRVAVTHRFILESRYTQAISEWHERLPAESLEELEAAMLTAVRRPEPTYVHVYWPGYDALSHHHGPHSAEAFAHLAAIDAMLDRLSRQLPEHDAALLVTADHGFVATPSEGQIDLSTMEGLYDSLATLPSGDTRAVSLFVRPARLDAVRERLAGLGNSVAVVEGETLLEAGVFGPGEPHPALYGRVGDLVLLARGDHAFSAPLRGQTPYRMAGNHGGMTEPEMCIPLFATIPE